MKAFGSGGSILRMGKLEVETDIGPIRSKPEAAHGDGELRSMTKATLIADNLWFSRFNLLVIGHFKY